MINEINLHDNKIEEFHIKQDCKMLKTLILSNNYLKIFPVVSDSGSVSVLKDLDLSNNLIYSISLESINEFQSLETLHLNGNELKELPKEIGLLKRLKLLDISSNRLTWLPKEITGLEAMKDFCARDNDLSIPPQEFVNSQDFQGICYYFESNYQTNVRNVAVVLLGMLKVPFLLRIQ